MLRSFVYFCSKDEYIFNSASQKFRFLRCTKAGVFVFSNPDGGTLVYCFPDSFNNKAICSEATYSLYELNPYLIEECEGDRVMTIYNITN